MNCAEGSLPETGLVWAVLKVARLASRSSIISCVHLSPAMEALHSSNLKSEAVEGGTEQCHVHLASTW